MWKLRAAALAASGAVVLATSAGAGAAAIGDANAGDVWVDTAAAPAGPGHEMDPHLPCANINLWGSGLADTAGTFAVDGWPPSGTNQQAYSGNWTYTHNNGARQSGSQVIATIDVTQLIATAAKNGDQPVNQNGYHFKLALSQDPQKYKTFWVNCPAPKSAGPTNTTPGSNSTATSGTSGNSGDVKGGHKLRKHKHKQRHHRLVKPKRLHRVSHRRISGATDTSAAFTG
jgi:hypothetical protein